MKEIRKQKEKKESDQKKKRKEKGIAQLSRTRGPIQPS
jgi:hypothetical protein